MTTITYLTKKQMNENGAEIRAFYDCDTDTINLPFHCSARMRLHEMAHAKYKHTCNRLLLNDFRDEVEAEIYSYSRMNKHIDWMVCYQGIIQSVDYCKSVNTLFHYALKCLADFNVPISCQEKSNMWNFIRLRVKYESRKSLPHETYFRNFKNLIVRK